MSHTYPNLASKYANPDIGTWQWHAADNMPLVRAPYDRGDSIKRVFLTGHLPKPKESDVHSRSVTSTNEETLGIEPSVYFYAGKVSPKVGGAVFLIPASVTPNLKACITPFDSGGLVVKTKLIPSNASKDERKDYLRTHETELIKFRNYLYYHLTEFFNDVDDYFTGPPPRPIDGCTFSQPKEFFDWTFEIRYEHDVPIEEMVVYLNRPLYDEIAELVESEDILFPEERLKYSETPGMTAEQMSKSVVNLDGSAVARELEPKS